MSLTNIRAEKENNLIRENVHFEKEIFKYNFSLVQSFLTSHDFFAES